VQVGLRLMMTAPLHSWIALSCGGVCWGCLGPLYIGIWIEIRTELR
jgi:hypothetical protein